MNRGILCVLIVLALAFSFGCTKPSYLETVYGTKSELPLPAQVCMAEAGNDDPSFYLCVVRSSWTSGNVSICESVFKNSDEGMTAKRDSCIFDAGVVARSSGFCERLEQGGFRHYCKAVIESTPDECLLIQENASLCHMFAEPNGIAGPGNGFALVCRQLSRRECLSRIAVDSDNPGSCEMVGRTCSLDSDVECRMDYDECYSRLAEKTGNSTLCRNIDRTFKGSLDSYNPERSMGECFLRAFNSSDRISECTKLQGRERGECISEYAVSTRSPAQCALIGQELRKTVSFPVKKTDYANPNRDWSAYAISRIHDDCLTNLAVNMKDPSICDGEFLVEKGGAMCLFELAVSTNDRSACDSITSEEIKSSCLVETNSSRTG